MSQMDEGKTNEPPTGFAPLWHYVVRLALRNTTSVMQSMHTCQDPGSIVVFHCKKITLISSCCGRCLPSTLEEGMAWMVAKETVQPFCDPCHVDVRSRAKTGHQDEERGTLRRRGTHGIDLMFGEKPDWRSDLLPCADPARSRQGVGCQGGNGAWRR